MKNFLLADAEQPIREALGRLVEKSEKRRPFVIIQKVVDRRIFVQFATHKDVLYFDVPLLGIYLEDTTPEIGTMRAVDALALLGVEQDQRVLIIEDEQKSKGEKLPLWERLFT